MKKRGRPKKARIIENIPEISQFSPRGRPGRPNEVDLTLDELEALRYADFEGKSQKHAAQLMGISQQTFSRVLNKARKTVAEGLTGGKRIKVAGGAYKFSLQRPRKEKDRMILLELAQKFNDRNKST